MLPFWLGEPEDLVLVGEEQLAPAREWCSRLEQIGIYGPRPVTNLHNLSGDTLELKPWGWSFNTIQQFQRAGVAPELLAPYEQIIPSYRALSHRQMQIELLSALQAKGIGIEYPQPLCASTIAEVEQFLERTGAIMVKSPWSSSGRGVFPVTAATFRSSIERIEGIIRHQGAVMVEPFLRKILDFALLFKITKAPKGEDKTTDFVGFSIFQNSTATNYGGNIVASDDYLRLQLLQYINEAQLDALINRLIDALSDIYADNYSGPIGVDMMVYEKEDHTLGLSPCIEVNLRHTMGFVARGIQQKTSAAEVTSYGRMEVNHSVSPQNGFPLVPSNADFTFIFRPALMQ